MSIESFWKDYLRHTVASPITRERIWLAHDEPVVCFEVAQVRDTIRLSNIRALELGKGYGTKALVWLTELAAKHNVMLTGHIAPTGTKRLKKRA